VMDLGVVAPLAVVSGILLWKRMPFGYLLSSVLVVKGASMGIALVAMIVNAWRSGVESSPVETVLFILLTGIMLFLCGKTLAAIREPAVAGA
jgi:hypothetical protein